MGPDPKSNFEDVTTVFLWNVTLCCAHKEEIVGSVRYQLSPEPNKLPASSLTFYSCIG